MELSLRETLAQQVNPANGYCLSQYLKQETKDDQNYGEASYFFSSRLKSQPLFPTPFGFAFDSKKSAPLGV